MTASRDDGARPESSELQRRVIDTLRVVPDFPSPGIRFQDITPVLGDAALFDAVVRAMADPWRTDVVTHVAGIESRGFILAAPVALALGAGFIPIRKPGKLPSHTAGMDYALEYGSDRLEMHVDACDASSRVLVLDDVLATGGTARAACALVESVGAVVVGCGFLLEIAALLGRERLSSRMLTTLVVR